MPFIPRKRLNFFPGNTRIFEENSVTDRRTGLILYRLLCFHLSVLFSCLKSAGSIHLPLLLTREIKITSRRKMRFCDHYYSECSYSRCALEIVESFHCETCTHAKITYVMRLYKDRRKLKQFKKELIKLGLLHFSLVALYTRPSREHHITAVVARVSRFFCNTFLWYFSQVRKKEIINPFLNPRRGAYGKLRGEKSDNGSEKEERTSPGSLLRYAPFY